ncbi:MAG: hypothetical protein AN485_15770 [Anabaena sp. MDT14b]|nr:MAG: hypothetical protein AN485_15770 [Anabaena sp. MDT14b]
MIARISFFSWFWEFYFPLNSVKCLMCKVRGYLAYCQGSDRLRCLALSPFSQGQRFLHPPFRALFPLRGLIGRNVHPPVVFAHLPGGIPQWNQSQAFGFPHVPTPKRGTLLIIVFCL